eukprot:4552839-Pyramimonas_sp.AAC.1
MVQPSCRRCVSTLDPSQPTKQVYAVDTALALGALWRHDQFVPGLHLLQCLCGSCVQDTLRFGMAPTPWWIGAAAFSLEFPGTFPK